MIRAGLPAMITLSGNVPETTLPAPTMQFLPRAVPLRIMELDPMKHPSPMVMGRFFISSTCWSIRCEAGSG